MSLARHRQQTSCTLISVLNASKAEWMRHSQVYVLMEGGERRGRRRRRLARALRADVWGGEEGWVRGRERGREGGREGGEEKR